jgi:hypothetical protein
MVGETRVFTKDDRHHGTYAIPRKRSRNPDSDPFVLLAELTGNANLINHLREMADVRCRKETRKYGFAAAVEEVDQTPLSPSSQSSVMEAQPEPDREVDVNVDVEEVDIELYYAVHCVLKRWDSMPTMPTMPTMPIKSATSSLHRQSFSDSVLDALYSEDIAQYDAPAASLSEEYIPWTFEEIEKSQEHGESSPIREATVQRDDCKNNDNVDDEPKVALAVATPSRHSSRLPWVSYITGVCLVSWFVLIFHCRSSPGMGKVTIGRPSLCGDQSSLGVKKRAEQWSSRLRCC